MQALLLPQLARPAQQQQALEPQVLSCTQLTRQASCRSHQLLGLIRHPGHQCRGQACTQEQLPAPTLTLSSAHTHCSLHTRTLWHQHKQQQAAAAASSSSRAL